MTPDTTRGDVRRALAAADVRVTESYTSAENANSPIGLFATVAVLSRRCSNTSLPFFAARRSRPSAGGASQEI
jgi:hypothetical protein